MFKRLFILGIGLGIIAVVATPASGHGCRIVHRRAVKVVEKVAVVEAVAVLPVVSAFAPAIVQAYGAAYLPGTGYAGAPYGQQSGYGGGQPDAVLAALQRLEQRLAGLEQRAGVAPPQAQQTAPMPPADIPPGALPQQGQTDNGGLANLSAEKFREVLRRVYSTDPKISMPRGKPPLTDEELSLVVQWVASPGPPAPEVVQLFTAKCASCHGSGREGAGGGFVLTLK